MPLVVLKSTRLSTAVGSTTTRVAVSRVVSNLSRTAEITTSITLISEVMPAITNDPKNRTPMRARSSKLELAKPTTRPEPVMSSRRLTYEAYVIMIPKPIDSEKKIWPKAAAHTDAEVSADQSGVKS